MGIQGLIGLLENATTFVNVRQLDGSVCVVDGYGWLHRACYACAHTLYAGQHTDQYVHYCLRRTQLLIDAGIKPILVFDGQRLPAKECTHNNRQTLRHNIRQKVELLLSEGHENKAKEMMRNCIEVTPKMAKQLMDALRERAIDFIVAPFEADAQMAYLVNNGFADFVITEDSDLLVYKCRLCLFKLDPNGNGRLVDMSLIGQCLGNGFDANKFRQMSILSGCDYLPNVPGIGLQRAKKFFKMTANTDMRRVLFKIPNYLKMSEKVKITKEYVEDFIKAENTFKYQLVFCPQRKKLIPLTPYENGVKVEDLKYAGSHFDKTLGPDFAFQYAIGNVDSKTLKVIDSYCFEPKYDSIWSKDWIHYKKKFTKNAIVLQELSLNKMTVNTSHSLSSLSSTPSSKPLTHKRRDNSQNEDNSHKRQKVFENRFLSHMQIMAEYSDNNESKKSNSALNSALNSNQFSYTSTKQIYSRNIFKIANDCNEEQEIQSKYFSGIQKDSYFGEDCNHLKTNAISGSNVSQYSLNSSGNTTINSTFDDTIDDSDRSEVSETSDEEIIAYKINSNKHLTKRSTPLKSTLTDIRSYFK